MAMGIGRTLIPYIGDGASELPRTGEALQGAIGSKATLSRSGAIMIHGGAPARDAGRHPGHACGGVRAAFSQTMWLQRDVRI